LRLTRSHAALLRRDARETIDFYRHRRRRRAAALELERCDSTEDLLRFTREHFVRPAAQNGSELVGFVDAVALTRPRVACEIGVQDGGTNFILSRALQVETMIGIDLHVSLRCQLRHFRRGDLELVLIDGPSQATRTRRLLAKALRGRPLDLLFIDGDHSRAGVLRDFLVYRHLVRAGGIIAFHDIVPDSTTRRGLITAGYAGDVPQVWSEVSSFYRSEEFIDDPDQDGAGIGLLYYDPAVIAPNDLSAAGNVGPRRP
jgi:predicted O-methyltransferase YrrM